MIVEELIELNGIDKTVRIKKSIVEKIVVEKVENSATPYMLTIKTTDRKFDDYLMFQTKEEANNESNKIV